ncbi:Spo0B domain-containing protein [Oceanobacillus salinisoli]|uniref:Spo0B domain-containing protein n=1 Tax=Oceanobacillus salinisoli TaxID=2678611 RepID=UPI0012E1345D|nr:Spo0B domain-containing protein [Oceanobacillus salinisoli]
MEDLEVVRLLQHYRHDLMNKLQLVHGYLNMGKINKAQDKMDELFSHFNEERKLISLQSPKLILWLIQFNHAYDNFRMTYNIHIDNQSLQNLDNVLYMKCKQIMDYCEKIGDPSELYDVELTINDKEETYTVEVLLIINGLLDEVHTLNINEENKDARIEVINQEDGMVCRILVPRKE